MANSDTFYQEIKEEATAIILEFGTEYNVYGEGSYDPLEGEELSSGPSRIVHGLISDQASVNKWMDGTGKLWTGTKALIMTADANPLKGEDVEVDGKRYPLSKLEPVKPADIVVIYMLELER